MWAEVILQETEIDMNEFKTYHPIVNFMYFVFVIGFSCFFMHPVSLCISFASGFMYSVMLKGKKTIKTNLIYMIPLMIITALINPAFNHEGASIITYLPTGNPLTLESIIYGLCASVMLVSVICHFSCYNLVMTSDKFIYLFGKIIPSMSLIISMTLRFVPRFLHQFKVVAGARKCMGRDVNSGSIIKRAKNGLEILSIVTTWAMENAIETADSMKSRGYGTAKRTAYSIYKFDKRDIKAFVYILLLAIYTLTGSLLGGMNVQFFPCVEFNKVSLFEISVFIAYFMLCICPVIIELWEVRKWKVLTSKI